jgi:hypothetical protein
MRIVFLFLGAVTAALCVGSVEAKSEIQFPWCAYYFDDTGGSNCGFDSQEQCQMTIRGTGGTCDRNAQYQAPVVPAAETPAVVPAAASVAPKGRPVAALTAKEKMKTCQFGADDQKLTGTARKTFISRCMSNRNDPRGSTPAAGPAPK